MKYLIISLTFGILFSSTSQAQRKYFQTFDDCLLLKTSISNSSLNLSLSPRSNGLTKFSKLIWYRPSVQNTIGIGLGFKDLALHFNFKLRQNATIEARQGNSKYSDLQIHSYGKKLGYDIYYQTYKGYYIENLDNFVNGLFSGNQLQQRDDLRLKNFSTNVFYVFNPQKFSYRSAFVLDEKQLRSGGSFILTGSLGYFQVSADSSIVPSNTDIAFHSKAHFNQVDFYTLAVTPGYAHNFVFPKGFYFSVGVSGLIGLQYHEGHAEEYANKGFHYFLKGIFKSSLGYNVEKWVAGISLTTDIQGMNTEFVQFRTNNLNISLFLARRIRVKWMKGKKSFLEFLSKKRNRAPRSSHSLTPVGYRK